MPLVTTKEMFEKAYNGERKIEWKEVLAGEKAYKATGQWLPQETLDAFRARHAITEQDYQKGLNALLEKLEGDKKRSF